MICPQCSTELKEDAKFCANCGSKVEPASEHAANLEAPEPQIHVQPPSADPGVNEQSGDQAAGAQTETSSQAKLIARSYFSFLVDSFKAPTRTASAVDASNKLFGLLTMIILTLLVPLLELISHMIYGIYAMNSLRSLQPIMGMFEGYFAETVGNYYSRFIVNSFLFSILTYAASLALTIVVLYVAANMLKVKLSFMDVASRFGAFMVIPTAIFVFGGVVSLLSLFALASFIRALGMLGIAIAILFTFRSFQTSESKLDTFYVYTILLAASYTLYRIVQMIFF